DKLTLTDARYPGQFDFTVRAISTKLGEPMGIHGLIVIVHYDYIQASLPPELQGEVDTIFSKVDNPAQGAAVAANIDDLFAEKDISTLTMSERALNFMALSQVSAILGAVDIASLVVFGIMMIVVGNTIAMCVRERTREYAVMRALGFGAHQIASSVIWE